MTSNSSLKKQIRDLAEREGIPYAEARRRIVSATSAFLDRLDQAMNETADVVDHTTLAARPEHSFKLFTIRQALGDDDKLPYPIHLDEYGFILGQGLWNGDPFTLIGFEDEESLNSEARRTISLTRGAFVADPAAAIGLYPVFSDVHGAWATDVRPVESIEVNWGFAGDPDAVTALLQVTTLEGSAVLESKPYPAIRVGDLFARLPRRSLAVLERALDEAIAEGGDDSIHVVSVSEGPDDDLYDPDLRERRAFDPVALLLRLAILNSVEPRRSERAERVEEAVADAAERHDTVIEMRLNGRDLERHVRFAHSSWSVHASSPGEREATE